MMMLLLLLVLLLLLLLPETLCPRLGSSACSLNVPRLGAFSIKCMRVCAFTRACVWTCTLAGMGVGKNTTHTCIALLFISSASDSCYSSNSHLVATRPYFPLKSTRYTLLYLRYVA